MEDELKERGKKTQVPFQSKAQLLSRLDSLEETVHRARTQKRRSEMFVAILSTCRKLGFRERITRPRAQASGKQTAHGGGDAIDMWKERSAWEEKRQEIRQRAGSYDASPWRKCE